MKQHLKALSVVLVIAIFSVWGFQTFFMKKVEQAPVVMNKLDQMKTEGVPSFSIESITGEKIDLSQLKGKVIILNFWASWCGPCVHEVPSLIKLAQSFKGEVKVLAISGDSNLEDINAFLKSFPDLNGENIKVIFDQDRSKMKIFDIARLPESLILDKSLKLAKKVTGSIDWYSKESIEYVDSLVKK